MLLTNDQGIRHQHKLERARVAVLQLDAPSNDANDLLRLVPQINEAPSDLSSGDFVVGG